MAKQLVNDKLWAILEPLIPPSPPRPKGGRPRLPDRAALTGILFVLKTGIQWEWLPQEMGCGSGMTCWRRLREWQEAGAWERLHELLPAELYEADPIDWARAGIHSSPPRAFGGAPRPAPGPAARPGGAPSNPRSPGCTSPAACASATNAATTSTKRSSRSAAA